MDLIILGIGLISITGIILFLFSKLTPNNTPKNLSKYYSRMLGIAIGAAVITFIVLGLIIHFVG